MTTIYTCFHTLRTALTVLVALATICGASGPSRADDVFTVSDVKVDITAENAVAAREKAFAQAQVEAFTALARKLLGESDFAKYGIPDVAAISLMIKDFEITSEQVSAVQYIGTYTFRFDGETVRAHFNTGGGVSYSDVASKPVLVIPFLQQGPTTILWRADNPWLAAWSNAAGTAVAGNLVPVVVPMGDIRDVADIGDDQSMTYDYDTLQSMLDRYGAGEAIILIAKPEGGIAGVKPALSVAMYRTDRAGPEYIRTLQVFPDAGMDAMALFEKAETTVRNLIQSDWKTVTAVNPVQENSTLRVSVIFDTMQQWVETRQALRRVQGIGEIKVLSVRPHEAQVEMVFAGDETRLRIAMAQVDLVLGQPVANDVAYGYAPAVYPVYLEKYAPF